MAKPDVAAQDLWKAAERLEDLDGIIDRARDCAGDLHDEVEELRRKVGQATQQAISLARRLEETNGDS